MPTIVPGYTTEQKVLTVADSDEGINAAITEQAAEGWMVVSLTVSGTDIIILFTRTTAAS